MYVAIYFSKGVSISCNKGVEGFFVSFQIFNLHFVLLLLIGTVDEDSLFFYLVVFMTGIWSLPGFFSIGNKISG